MLVANYKTKKELKENIGKRLKYTETSLFGSEYGDNSYLTVVGPSAYNRKWFANIQMESGVIQKVS